MKIVFLLFLCLLIGCQIGERLRPDDIEVALENALQRNADILAKCFSYNFINEIKNCSFNGSIEILFPETPITDSVIGPLNLTGNVCFGLDKSTIPAIKVPLAIRHYDNSCTFWGTYFWLILLFLAGVFVKYIWRFIKWACKILILKGTSV